MRALLRLLLYASVASLLLAACQYIPPTFQVYKLDINQGNYITEDQVQKLKVGQTKQQVRLMLGTPLLADPFHADRWDYVYEFERQGRTVERTQLTLFYVDGKLARWENSEMPPSPIEVARSGNGDARLDKSLSLAPKTGETNWLQDLLRKLGWWE
jgi:outer membrane protein assembly factor BamE